MNKEDKRKPKIENINGTVFVDGKPVLEYGLMQAKKTKELDVDLMIDNKNKNILKNKKKEKKEG